MGGVSKLRVVEEGGGEQSDVRVHAVLDLDDL